MAIIPWPSSIVFQFRANRKHSTPPPTFLQFISTPNQTNTHCYANINPVNRAEQSHHSLAPQTKPNQHQQNLALGNFANNHSRKFIKPETKTEGNGWRWGSSRAEEKDVGLVEVLLITTYTLFFYLIYCVIVFNGIFQHHCCNYLLLLGV